MDINDHPLLKRAADMEAMIPYWEKVDAILAGWEGVTAAGTKYLPKFSGEDENDYLTRLQLTKFTNIFRDVTESLASKPFEEEVSIIGEQPPDEIAEFLENVDGFGNNLTVFTAQTFFNGVCYGLDWVFVDYPTVDSSLVRTLADQKAANIKPYWSHVLAQNVLEARNEVIGNKQVLSYIRILEPSLTDKRDRVRIFKRFGDSVYWELWEKNPQAMKITDVMIQLIKPTLISINTIPLVPFMTGRRDGNSFKFLPTMSDVVDLQIQLYRDESALQFIKTMAGYPMLAANGMKPQMEADGKTPKKLSVGPMKVLYGIPDGAGGHGQWSFIEPQANSMEFLNKSILETKRDLRELGRQPLTSQSEQLTVITSAVAAGKARSAVTAWALMLKDALENAILITSMWMGSDYKPQINVYTEFDNFIDTEIDITELGNARRNRDISLETYWAELKRRKVLSPEFDAEEEMQRLLEDIPVDEPDSPIVTTNV